jgi:SAM-dependent methyltransferase
LTARGRHQYAGDEFRLRRASGGTAGGDHQRGTGRASIDGLRLLDLGCGFGALSVFFAAQGAIVTGVDPIESRLHVGASVAAAHGLAAEFRHGWMEDLDLDDETFDLAVQNNSFCYIVPRDKRRAALAETRRVLKPGGSLVIRNPNRWNPLDQFTGLPMIQLLPPGQTSRLAELLGRSRSEVRLASPLEATRELRQAGFLGVALVASPASRWPALMKPFARYQHLAGRRPICRAENRDATAAPGEPGGEAFGLRLSRDASTYLMGAVITFFLALISISVTRFLTPPSWGAGASLTFAAFSHRHLQRRNPPGDLLLRVRVSRGGGGGRRDTAAAAETAGLGDGLMTTCLPTAGTLVIAAFAPWFADRILDTTGSLSGCDRRGRRRFRGDLADGLDILRMEVPHSYKGSTVRPILVVGCHSPVATGARRGAIRTAIGGVLSIVVGRGDPAGFELSFSTFDARMIRDAAGCWCRS